VIESSPKPCGSRSVVCPLAKLIHRSDKGRCDGGEQMPRLTIGILGAIAISLSLALGAAFALGRDLSEAKQDHSGAAVDIAVNRATKADRAVKASASPVETRTIVLQLNGFSDTSFLVRVPVANGAGNLRPSSPIKPGHPKAMAACEAVVSMLTEVARQLQPGRCVT
jgi:hypothetical protein